MMISLEELLKRPGNGIPAQLAGELLELASRHHRAGLAQWLIESIQPLEREYITAVGDAEAGVRAAEERLGEVRAELAGAEAEFAAMAGSTTGRFTRFDNDAAAGEHEAAKSDLVDRNRDLQAAKLRLAKYYELVRLLGQERPPGAGDVRRAVAGWIQRATNR